ncbi:aldehyde dehydrogenase family protein [Kocuria rhizophila]|nr:aldehyde dehydrogenase family protein [Kocuria rhizophila]
MRALRGRYPRTNGPGVHRGRAPPRTSRPALDAAWAAAPSWNASTPAQRALMLNKIADRMEQHLETIAVAETWADGKPVREMLNADIPRPSTTSGTSPVPSAPGGPPVPAGRGHRGVPLPPALGVVGQIIRGTSRSSWPVWKLAPALAADVVLKPAEQTPGLSWCS